jgi:hypothetical protein
MPGLTELGRRWNDAVEAAPQPWNTLQFSDPGMTHQAEQTNPAIAELARRLSLTGQNLYNTWIAPAERLGRAATSGTLDVTDPQTAGDALGTVGLAATARVPFVKAGELGALGSKLPPASPEKIQAAATRYGGKVYTGNVHFQSLEAAAADHGMDISQFIDKVNKEAGKTEATHDLDGFVTTSGRFVTRQEARDIADRADQLTNLARKEGKPNLSMEEIALGQRPGFGQPSQKMSD